MNILTLENYALFTQNSNVIGIPSFSLQNMATLVTWSHKTCSWPDHYYLQENLGHIAHTNCKTNENPFSELKGEEWVLLVTIEKWNLVFSPQRGKCMKREIVCI